MGSMTLQQFRDELRTHLGVDTDDLPDPDADLLINRAYWSTLNKFNFREKDATTNIDTVASTAAYTLPVTLEAVQTLYIAGDSEEKAVKLEQMSTARYAELYTTNTDEEGKPTHYVRFADSIRLYPTPDDVYTIIVGHLAILTDMGTTGTGTPREWDEVILFGAVKRGHLRLKEYTKAQIIHNVMADEVNTIVPVQSKEERDMRYAAVSVPMKRTY